MPPGVAFIKGNGSIVGFVFAQYAEKFAYKAIDGGSGFTVACGERGLDAKKGAISLGMAVDK